MLYGTANTLVFLGYRSDIHKGDAKDKSVFMFIHNLYRIEIHCEDSMCISRILISPFRKYQ